MTRRSSDPSSTASTKPSWKRRVLVGINVLLAIVLIASVGAFGYIKWRYGNIDKIDFGSILQKGGPKEPMTVLVVGSDSRRAESKESAKSFGSEAKVPGQRSDTIMLVRVDPKAQRAAILSVPRDTYVSIAQTRTKARINSAFEEGPQRLAETIQQEFDIPIHHYVQVDFEAFQGIVNTLGGVEVPFAAPVRDWGLDELTGTTRNLSGLDIPQTGCVKLDGKQALSYVRSRHFQVKERGRWIPDPQSDLGRIQRQQDFMRRVMRVAGEKAKNPTTANALVSNVVENLSMDNGFSLSDLQSLALRFRSLDPSKVQMMTLPTKPAEIAGMSVLLKNDPEATATIQTFMNGQPTPSDAPNAPKVSVGSVSVRVLNGTGESGLASDVADQMRTTGFVVSTVGDAKPGQPVTSIRYGHGQKEKAELLAKYLNGEVRITEDKSVVGVSAVVTLGKSFTGYAAGGNATTTTTSTAPTPEPTQPESPPTTSLFVPSPDVTC